MPCIVELGGGANGAPPSTFHQWRCCKATEWPTRDHSDARQSIGHLRQVPIVNHRATPQAEPSLLFYELKMRVRDVCFWHEADQFDGSL
jgi:hypothetical protein